MNLQKIRYTSQKTIKAKIFDPENDKFLSDILLTIKRITPSEENKKPYYEVSGRFETMKLEFSDKTFLLEINPSLRGFSFFSINSVAGMFTVYKIVLQDSIWMNTDWFKSLL